MILKKWEDLPAYMQVPEVRPYYDILRKRKLSILIKRVFDYVVAVVLLILLALPMAVIAIMVKTGSPGPVFYRQERVTIYGKRFKIHKFRTMVENADQIGAAVTSGDDFRVTAIGRKLRRLRLDELPQLFDVIQGNMSFVGTRPEATVYVNQYEPEYYATLLLPAGITSETSIQFKDEEQLLENVNDVDTTYMEIVLPQKMKYNLQSIKDFSFMGELVTMIKTALVVLGKNDNKR